jgi:hypothetical protein
VSGPSIEQIKQMANARMGDVLAALGVHERDRGGYISMCNPQRADKRASFTIWTRGGFVAFKDYADDAVKGDIVDLVAYLNGWWDRPKRGAAEAIAWLKHELGIQRMSIGQQASAAAQARAQAAQERQWAAAEDVKDKRRAKALWLNAKPIEGSIGAHYLLQRGVDISALPRPIHFLRFLASHRHRGDRVFDPDTEWPCLVACCVDAGGKINAVHRTWLARDGSSKAPVKPARKCWPSVAGLIIPVWKGLDGLTVKEAIANGVRETLVLTEGIEDGLSAAIAAPQHRVWAAISLSNFQNVPLPECIDSIILHRQNDWDKPAAVASFERAKAALEARGRPVAEVRAFAGKDLNDTLRGAA